MLKYEDKKTIWENAKFYCRTGLTEDVIFIDNDEGRIAIFCDGQVSIHNGPVGMMEDMRPQHSCCSYSVVQILNGIIKAANENKYKEEAKLLEELREEIMDYSDLSEDEWKVAEAVDAMLSKRGYDTSYIWRYDENNLHFDFVRCSVYIPPHIRNDEAALASYIEGRLWHTMEEMNEVAKKRNSKIKFKVIYYDNGGAYPAGISASW